MPLAKESFTTVRCLVMLLAVTLGNSLQTYSLSDGEQHLPTEAYPLRHFLQFDADRVAGSSSFCLGCPKLDGTKLTMADYDIQTEQRDLAPPLDRRIVEIHTRLSTKPDVKLTLPQGVPDVEGRNYFVPNAVVWKVILVEETSGFYRELYRFHADAWELDSMTWASSLQVDNEGILITNDPWGGNGGFCSDGYWQVDASGARPIDFSSVDAAMVQHTPKGSQLTQTRCWALDVAHETIQSPAQKPGSCHACGYTAEIVARFHLKGNRAIPDNVEAQAMESND
jgi:hypothetical protein